MPSPVENSEGLLFEENNSRATASNLIQNSSFENGATPWIQYSGLSHSIIIPAIASLPAHTGLYYAVLGGQPAGFDSVWQPVTIPANATSATLEFWYQVVSTETTTSRMYDLLVVAMQDVRNVSDITSLTTLSNLNKALVWVKSPVLDVSAFKGRAMALNFGALVDATNGTYFVIDDVSLNVITSTNNTVVEFYNTNLDNYFITADASEATAIDSGSAGAGWSRTGNTFNSGGSTSVCRFYGSQSPGPNSHFYTVDPGECTSLKQIQSGTPATQKRWNFESLDFVSTPPANGTCPSATLPVYRAYNNGFARGIDSNHRITSNLADIQQVVARGWSNEGIVMCAPQ